MAVCPNVVPLRFIDDKFAVSLLKNATVVGHVPPEFSRVFGIGSFCCHRVVVYYLQFLFSCVAFSLPDEATSHR